MTPAFKYGTTTIAKSGTFPEGDYSYITPDGLRALFASLAPVTTSINMPINRNGRKVGEILKIHLVDHENGCFIEGDYLITDEQTVGLPSAHIDQVIRMSIAADGFKLTEDEPVSLGVKP